MRTDEERQKLVASLRIYEHIGGLGPMCRNAADEIERLAALLKDYRLTFGDIHDVKWIHPNRSGEK